MTITSRKARNFRGNKVYIVFCTLFLLLLGSFVSPVWSQRVEIEVNKNPDTYQLVSLQQAGVILFSDEPNKIFGSEDTWTFAHYDSSFALQWEGEIKIPKGNYFYQGFDTSKQALFILFIKFSGEFLIVEINTVSKLVTEHTFSSIKNFNYQDFTVLNRFVFISGVARNTPLILHVKLNSPELPPQILKTAYDKRTELELLDKDTLNDIVKVTSLYWKGGKASLRVQSFLANGEQVYDLPVLPKKSENLLTAKVSVNREGKLLIMGTFANKNTRYADGIYIAEHDGTAQQFIQLYNFTELTNYFSYLPEERQEALLKKTERRQAKGKELNLQHRLFVHDVIEREQQYIFTAEAYMPTYRYERRRDWLGGTRVLRTVQVFDGYDYTHAVVVGFNNEGALLWDGSFAIEARKLMRLKELVKVSIHQGRSVRLLYSDEGRIFSKTIENNKVVKGQSIEAIPTEYQSDDVKRSYINNLEYWYGDYFLAWGFQKIKNSERSSAKTKRNVLYFNKVKY